MPNDKEGRKGERQYDNLVNLCPDMDLDITRVAKFPLIVWMIPVLTSPQRRRRESSIIKINYFPVHLTYTSVSWDKGQTLSKTKS